MTVVRSPWEIAAELLYPLPNPYVKDPVTWTKDVLGEVMWSRQAEVAQSVVNNRYTAVQSAHDTGKSWVSSRLFLWWLSVHEVGTAFGVSTAPTTAQVEAILWREIERGHRKGGLKGKITGEQKWKIGEELVAYGRKPADYDQAAFQGIHALHTLIIIDEADGVPKSLFDAVDALATNVNARVLAIGNPDNPSSHFASICKPGSGWNVHKISAFDTPAFTGEKVPESLLPLLISPEWVEERKKRWGVTSPIYQSKVLGEFPDVSDSTLIHPKWIKAAQERTLERTHKPVLGIDIARFGEDETVMYRREGGWVRLYRAHNKADTMETTGHIARAFTEINAETRIQAYLSAVIDEVGVGAGVFDRARELGLDIVGVNGGQSPADKERFINARAESFWNLREMFESGDIDIDPDDDQLAAQLGAIQWKLDSRGRVQIESKDEIRKRGLPSPDRADALVYAFFQNQSSVIDVNSHKGLAVTGDLLNAQW